ncbi:hypothetical protein [Glutamicibacter protophormiae]|uniref:Phage tail protein n=1 Tax=Glutamicibacter protophormiae TaxID=37930 RepID=A0ABS4XQX7_GLUPR|nr:hypothetical protein [Glutamicibacter protophormiae]MBP2398913.1 hypothetical protein [Glutamicibacter protophormiae]GGL83544.1 hypothetical protein GCM10010038_11810 [Glutamicibacter protophormiae]
MRFRFDGVEFGDKLPLFVTDFDQGTTEYRTNDTERSQGDGMIAGRDFLGGRTWGFSVSTNMRNLPDASMVESRLAAAWHNPKHRSKSLALVPLSYELGGRWRRVYGRPSRYAGIRGDIQAVQGHGRIECDFRIHDPRYFDDVETVLPLPIVPASTGGLMAPLVAPLSTVRSSAPRAGFVDNTGTAPTPLKVIFKGPVVDPYVRSAAGWEIALNATILPGQTVTVDALAGSVLRGNAPAAGLLTRKTRLSSAVLPTGVSDLTFGGIDPTGTASVELRWRNAYWNI